MNSLLATIIVVSFNSRRWLPRMCTALAAQTEPRWRLILLDNGSRVEERPHQDELPAGSLLIQCEENLGFAAGNNRAAEDALTPYLIFLNPDAFPEPDWLAHLLALAARHPEAGAIGSTQLRADQPGIYDGLGDVLHASGIAYRSAFGAAWQPAPPLGETFSACAAAMLVRREAWEAVGGFDPSYFCYFEDVDLGFRLRLAGWRVLQCPDARVAHVGGGVAGARSPFAAYYGARNRTWTFCKCMPALLFWPLLPSHLLASAAAVTVASLRDRTWAPWLGLIAGIKSARLIWRARKQVKRIASLRTIIAALAWSPDVFFTRRPVIKHVQRTTTLISAPASEAITPSSGPRENLRR